MAQANYGEVRIITQNGSGSTTVPIGCLSEALIEASRVGEGIIELSTSLGIHSETEPLEPEQRTCPSDKNCPVTIIKDYNRGKALVAAKGFVFPEECIQCAGRQIAIAVGLMPRPTGLPHFVASEE